MLSGLKSSANVVSCKFESSLTKPDFHHKKQVNRSLPISFRLRTSQSGPDAGASTTQGMEPDESSGVHAACSRLNRLLHAYRVKVQARSLVCVRAASLPSEARHAQGHSH